MDNTKVKLSKVCKTNTKCEKVQSIQKLHVKEKKETKQLIYKKTKKQKESFFNINKEITVHFR